MRGAVDKGHLVELRKLEFKFIRSILGIPQYTLELVGPVVVLNPLFKLSGRSLVAVRFGLQVVQGSVRKLQFTFLANVNITNGYIQGTLDAPGLCIDLGEPFLVRVDDQDGRNPPRGHLPGVSGSPRGSRFFVPHCAAVSPVPPRLVKMEMAREVRENSPAAMIARTRF